MISRPILLALRDAERAVSDAARGVGGTFQRLRLATDRAERLAAKLSPAEAAEVEREIANLDALYRQALESYRPNRAGQTTNWIAIVEVMPEGYHVASSHHTQKAAVAAARKRGAAIVLEVPASHFFSAVWHVVIPTAPNRAGRKPKAIGSSVWIHAHNGDPMLLDEDVGGGLVREIAGPHRLDVQAKVGRRDATATAKAWMENHPPLSEHAYLEIQDDKAGELVARYAGVPRKRGGGYQWEAQARPRRAPPVRKGPPAGYVPWKKEPQYLFADPTYRQAAELTARQYGIAPSALETPAPAPLPPPPRREYKFTERGQGQLFNAAGGRARRRRRSRRNACGCGG
jgi:hypothetical protein